MVGLDQDGWPAEAEVSTFAAAAMRSFGADPTAMVTSASATFAKSRSAAVMTGSSRTNGSALAAGRGECWVVDAHREAHDR